MEIRDFGLGCIPNTPDPRDYIFIPTKVNNISFPQNFKLESTVIKNQGNVNSCVAHSISTIKEIQEFYETKKKMTFSVGWLYGYRVDNQYKGEGMCPRDALNNLVKYGNVLSADFPENKEYDDIQELVRKRKMSCLLKGKKWRAKAYAKVTSDRDVKNCIYVNHSPVMICCDIYDSFYKTGRDGKVSASLEGQNRGNHAMTIVGWQGDDWIIQNSWGQDFADRGYCYINMGSRFITDMYTVTDLKNIVV